MLPAAFLLLILGVTAAAAAVTPICKSEYPHRLDVAFYWARLNLSDPGGRLIWDKSCIDLNVTAPAFNPNAPSTIIVHGLQPSMVEAKARFATDGDFDDILRGYLFLGENVGAFLWGQFGDNDVLKFVYTEEQIYTPDGFDKTGYIVRTKGDKMRKYNGPAKTIPDYFIDGWRFHFPDGRDYPRVEIVGHSLGTQVALRAAWLLYTQPVVDKKPDAVTLLDAVMSPKNKHQFERSPCGRTISKNMGCMARDLNLNFSVPLRYFKSSFINYCIFSAREDVDIVEYTAFSTVKFDLFGPFTLQSCWDNRLLGPLKNLKGTLNKMTFQMMWQHIMIVPYYFASRFFPPHICVVNHTASARKEHRVCRPTPALALSAAMPDADVLGWSRPPLGSGKGHKLCFHEYDDRGEPGFNATTAPTMNIDPGDDLFLLRPCRTTST